MNKEWFVLVEMFQGLPSDVKLFKDEKEAEDRFEKFTGISYKEYSENEEVIQHTNYAGTTILVKEVEGKENDNE